MDPTYCLFIRSKRMVGMCNLPAKKFRKINIAGSIYRKYKGSHFKYVDHNEYEFRVFIFHQKSKCRVHFSFGDSYYYEKKKYYTYLST